ncbi:hypothetical protein Trydic_g1161 [Trypoxylus dichotomus]
MPLIWMYMHDNDPKHVSHRDNDWLRGASVKVLVWSTQSPGNPMEDLWTDVKQAIFAVAPTLRQKLWETVERTLSSILDLRCHALQRRCETVITNKGYTTKY